MDILVPLFWVIVIIVWLISALAKKQAGTSQGEPPREGEGYRKPEEALARFLRSLSGEEEIKATPPPFEPLVERVVPPPSLPESEPRVERVTSPRVEEPVFKVEPQGRREEISSSLLGTLDISAIRRGIILSEILGPPRGERPF